jgi:hypothetical protein
VPWNGGHSAITNRHESDPMITTVSESDIQVSEVTEIFFTMLN